MDVNMRYSLACSTPDVDSDDKAIRMVPRIEEPLEVRQEFEYGQALLIQELEEVRLMSA